MSGHRGVGLIELMIGLGIAAFLLMAGVPAFTAWIQNSQNRTAAESILNALQLARIEAIKRNTLVRFELTDANGRVAWNVGCVTVTSDCPASIQKRSADDGLANARVGISKTAIPLPISSGYFSDAIAAGTGLAAGVSFNGMGRVPADNSGEDIARIDVTNAASREARRFVVMIGAGGQVRMCDPALAFSSNPQGCS